MARKGVDGGDAASWRLWTLLQCKPSLPCETKEKEEGIGVWRVGGGEVGGMNILEGGILVQVRRTQNGAKSDHPTRWGMGD